MDRLIGWSIKESINRSVDADRLISWSFDQSIDQSIDRFWWRIDVDMELLVEFGMDSTISHRSRHQIGGCPNGIFHWCWIDVVKIDFAILQMRCWERVKFWCALTIRANTLYTLMAFLTTWQLGNRQLTTQPGMITRSCVVRSRTMQLRTITRGCLVWSRQCVLMPRLGLSSCITVVLFSHSSICGLDAAVASWSSIR